MANVSQFDLIEIIGTSDGDRLRGRGEAVVFGREGTDLFRSVRTPGDEDQFFFGGSGADTYLMRPQTTAFIGDGFSSDGDTVRLEAVVFGAPTVSYLEIGQRDLAIFDFDSGTGIWLLDWLNPVRAIEHFEFANERLTLGEDLTLSVIRRQPGYLGTMTFEEVLGSDVQAFRDVSREAFARAGEIERTSQPELIQITGTFGDDTLNGDGRGEILRGLAGSDTINADDGADRVAGGKGDDLIDGGLGRDDLRGGGGADELAGGDDEDRLTGDAGRDALTGGRAADTLLGGTGHDRLTGNGGDDVLLAGRGNDVLAGSAGADWLIGGDGLDQMRGGKGPDLLEGGPGDDVLLGNQGFDVLRGLENDDVLDGGVGADTLEGGDGADLFVFSTLDAEIDTVLDFGPADGDRLDLGRLLPGFAPGDPVAEAVQLRIEAGSTVVAVDPSAAGGPFQDVVRLQDVVIDDLRPFQLGLPLAPTSTSQFDGSAGFRLQGGGLMDRSGSDVASAGDVNGDGFADLLIGASGSGRVVFGGPDPFPPVLQLIPLDPAAGFTAAGDEALWVVSDAGDVDGDGLSDVALGAPTASAPSAIGAGQTYVVFGAAVVPRPDVDVTSLHGGDGFRLDGSKIYEASGTSLAAGDINGDGLSDIIIGAFGAPQGVNDASRQRTYVVLGTSDERPPTLGLNDLDGGDGFRIRRGGAVVGSAGDVNGDGHDDVLIGAPEDFQNAAFLVFGAASGWPASLDLAATDRETAVRFEGGAAGSLSSVSGAGDFNGDGFADLIIGSSSRADIVFGKARGFPSTVNLDDLDGVTGTTIEVARFAESGFAVSGGGDVNGDGLDDIVVGAPFADSHGVSLAGAVYVIYGKTGALPATIDLASLRVDQGFRVGGASESETLGYAVSYAGDVNGDGFADVIAGTGFAGRSYVIFGGDFSGAVDQLGTAAGDVLSGGARADTLLGAQGDDVLVGNGGRDVLNGGAGDDVLTVADDQFLRLLGGGGNDTLRLDGTGMELDLRTVSDLHIRDMEVVDLNGGGNSLALDPGEILNLSDTSNRLAVLGEAGDAVRGDFGGAVSGATTIDGIAFNSFSLGAAELLVQAGVDIAEVAV